MSGTNPLLALNIKADAQDPRAHLAALLDAPLVTVTGSRACTSYGEHITSEIVTELVRAGATILTGGSYGIDATVMRAAASCGGRVVVVLANGVDKAYPTGNALLLDRVVSSGGALVSAYPADAVPNRTRFVERTELLMVAADAVVIPEAGWRSSALAGVSKVDAVPAYAVPGPVTSAVSAGPHYLIRSGRASLLVPDREAIEALVANARARH